MRIATVQMQILPGEVQENFKTGVKFIEQARQLKCKLVLLPEVWTTGFKFKQLKELSKTTNEIIEELKKLSKDICICGSYAVDNPKTDKVFNIFYAIYNGSIIFEYKKVMLFGLSGEDKYFDKGDFSQNNVFEFDGVKIGVSICYEMRFPEFFRKAALNGALIHLNPALWPKERIEPWKILSMARAIENQFFLVTSNGIKASGAWMLGGYSTIFDGLGKILACAEENESLIYYDVDLNELNNIRLKLPFLVDGYVFKEIYV